MPLRGLLRFVWDSHGRYPGRVAPSGLVLCCPSGAPATLATSRCFPSGQLLMRTFPYRLSSSSCLIGTTSHQCARHPHRSLRYRSAARTLPAPDHPCAPALTPHSFHLQPCLSKTCPSTLPRIPAP